ncbi:hypothetical protein [Rhizobium sp. A37_96]
MSSVQGIYSWESLLQSARRFRYVEFLLKSTPVISIAFIVYVLLKGILW